MSLSWREGETRYREGMGFVRAKIQTMEEIYRVWSKYSNCMSLQRPAMMNSRHEGQPLGTSAGLCNGAGESGIAAPERVPSCGESDPASTSASSIAAYRSGAVYLGGDWQAAPAEKARER